jgi:hypothetical protein
MAHMCNTKTLEFGQNKMNVLFFCKLYSQLKRPFSRNRGRNNIHQLGVVMAAEGVACIVFASY